MIYKSLLDCSKFKFFLEILEKNFFLSIFDLHLFKFTGVEPADMEG